MAAGEGRSPGLDAQRGAAGVEAFCVCVLIDAHTGVLAGAGQFERQLGRMNERTRVGVVQAREIGR
jgi:hypothetical protein